MALAVDDADGEVGEVFLLTWEGSNGSKVLVGVRFSTTGLAAAEVRSGFVGLPLLIGVILGNS